MYTYISHRSYWKVRSGTKLHHDHVHGGMGRLYKTDYEPRKSRHQMAFSSVRTVELDQTSFALALICKREADFIPRLLKGYICSDSKSCIIIAPMGGTNRQVYKSQINILRQDAMYIRDADQLDRPQSAVFHFRIASAYLADVPKILNKTLTSISMKLKSELNAVHGFDDTDTEMMKTNDFLTQTQEVWQTSRAAIPTVDYAKYAIRPSHRIAEFNLIRSGLHQLNTNIKSFGDDINRLETALHQTYRQLIDLAECISRNEAEVKSIMQ